MIFDALWNYALFQLAGLWAVLVGYGLGVTFIACFLAAAYFSPLFKKDFLWGAIAVGVFMLGFTIGVFQGEKRIQAQWDVAKSSTITKAREARSGAVRDVARKPSRWLPNKRDAYDRDG